MKVIIATDGSDAALEAAQRSLSLLKPGARIAVAMVIPNRYDPNEDAGGFEGPVMSDEQADAEFAAAKSAGEAALGRTVGVVGVDAQVFVVGQRLFAPDDGIARVVAQAVEQLGEVEVEVGQEGVHADHVRQRHAEVAAVLLHPALERGPLRIPQPHAQGLEALQVLVRHGADGHQAQLLGQQHVGSALEELRQFSLEAVDHLALPGELKAPAQPEV